MRVLPWKLPRTDSCSYGSESKLKYYKETQKVLKNEIPQRGPLEGLRTIKPFNQREGGKGRCSSETFTSTEFPDKKNTRKKENHRAWLPSMKPHLNSFTSCYWDTQKSHIRYHPSLLGVQSDRWVLGGRGLYRGGGRHTSGELRWEGFWSGTSRQRERGCGPGLVVFTCSWSRH